MKQNTEHKSAMENLNEDNRDKPSDNESRDRPDACSRELGLARHKLHGQAGATARI
ncbi:hypothetical protein ALC62_04216 [Cyphomyrmex costatus]|uniref:Uncharacterized protein n=1 Tax=Cyphomyrmex costatus TaxID=456900 RepID=A0A195CWB9_9HYME|nr:hypothetical protein ALC62_04216 [Cyphomyrmex costatus]